MQDYFYFLNRKNVANGFRESLNSRFFVDKSMLIQTISEKILRKVGVPEQASPVW